MILNFIVLLLFFFFTIYKEFVYCASGSTSAEML
jgi:hypothetical protein